jgi:hypothetical protein
MSSFQLQASIPECHDCGHLRPRRSSACGSSNRVGCRQFRNRRIDGLDQVQETLRRLDYLTWADGDKKGALAIQCDKNDYRGVLAALEGVTGKKAVNSDTMTVKN